MRSEDGGRLAQGYAHWEIEAFVSEREFPRQVGYSNLKWARVWRGRVRKRRDGTRGVRLFMVDRSFDGWTGLNLCLEGI